VIERIRRRPPEADFDDVRAVLELYGWTLDRQQGSHVSFVHDGEHAITAPIANGKVKRIDLTRICEALGLNDEETH